MLGVLNDETVCWLQSLWDEVAAFPVYQSTKAMRVLLQQICLALEASDASWLVMRRMELNQLNIPEEHFKIISNEMKGWAPVTAMSLNPDSKLTRVLKQWSTHVCENGIDPMTYEFVKGAGVLRAWTREDVVTDREWQDHWISQKFLHYYGVGERMFVAIPVTLDCECVVMLDRPLRGNPFGQMDKRLLQIAVSGQMRLHRQLCLERGAIDAAILLSRRERETYCYLLTSMSEFEISEHMNLSAHTVHDYARKLYRKFGVKGRIGLMARVLGSE